MPSPAEASLSKLNPALKDDPSLVNSDPYGKGWMIKLKSPGANLSALISGEDYTTKHGG